MANLYNLEDYSKEISVYDYENDKQIIIKLDESKTLKDNANKFYKLYNKAKTSNAKLNELIEDLKQKQSYNESLLYSIRIAENIEELHELNDEVVETPKDKQKKNPSQNDWQNEKNALYV